MFVGIKCIQLFAFNLIKIDLRLSFYSNYVWMLHCDICPLDGNSYKLH